MSIYRDSYKTITGSMFNIRSIEQAILQSFIKDGLHNSNLGIKTVGPVKPVFILGVYESESNIPNFDHPLLVRVSRDEEFLCTDLRLHVRKGVTFDNVSNYIKNNSEYNFFQRRAVLNLVWLNGGIGQIKNGLTLASSVFSTWLSDTISKVYSLNYNESSIIAVITSIYYQSLFNDEKEFTEDTKQRMVAHTMKVTKSNSDFIFKVLDQIHKISDINEYCQLVSKLVQNDRLKDFNLAILLTMIKNSWYGTNSKSVISISLEHPPTWCAIIYAVINDRSFNNTNISKYVKELGKRGGVDEYNHAFSEIIKQYSVSNEAHYLETDPFDKE